MTIKFICSCGKHLRARDEMAARRSACPRCGSPVGVPSLEPTHRGTVAAPMTPTERLRHARANKPVPAPDLPRSEPPSPANPLIRSPSPPPATGDDCLARLTAAGHDPRLLNALTRQALRRHDLAGRHLERHWHECLTYPFCVWRLVVGLALFLTMLSAAAAVVLPVVLADTSSDLVPLVGGPLLLFVAAIPCSFLDCVLVSAATGEAYCLAWSGSPLLQLPRSGIKWLACFLAGPAVFAALAWSYWLRCGEPGFVDGLILTELVVVGAAYFALVLAALTRRGRLRDLNPLAVADLAQHLGWRALFAVLAAAALLLADGWLLLTGVAEIHTSWQKGLLLLTGGWLSGLYGSTFFCRLLGVWCFRNRPETETTSASDGQSPAKDIV